MRQGNYFQTYFYFLKKTLEEVKASGLQLSFNIFRQPYTIETNYIKFYAIDPET